MSAPPRRLLRRPDDPVHGTLFLPGTSPPIGGVLVIGGSGGTEPSYVAEPLAAAGFAALSVAYFARPGLPTDLREIPLEYFRDAAQLLIDASRSPRSATVSVIGMSRGSEAALLWGIHFGHLIDRIVATVPSAVITGSSPPGGPAWLLGGRPIPYGDRAGPSPSDSAAVIPVERVQAPILLISAGADEVWPSSAMATVIADRLRGSGFRHEVAHLDYPDAGHSLGYLVPSLPPDLLPPDIADRAADRVARADAWKRTLDFLHGGNAARS